MWIIFQKTYFLLSATFRYWDTFTCEDWLTRFLISKDKLTTTFRKGIRTERLRARFFYLHWCYTVLYPKLSEVFAEKDIWVIWVIIIGYTYEILAQEKAVAVPGTGPTVP